MFIASAGSGSVDGDKTAQVKSSVSSGLEGVIVAVGAVGSVLSIRIKAEEETILTPPCPSFARTSQRMSSPRSKLVPSIEAVVTEAFPSTYH